MDPVFHLYRRPEGGGGLRKNWNYANRIADAGGGTLFTGSTPNRFFKSAVTFQDQNGKDALVFGANRAIAPGAFISGDTTGRKLFRIELPVAARLRPKASMQLIAASTGARFEIVPSHVATDSELTRLVAVFQEEFVVRQGDQTVAYTGRFDPESAEDEAGVSPARKFAGALISDIAKIPGNIVKMKKGIREDRPAGTLTISSEHASAELALTLLIFRACIYKNLQSPQQSWWQGD